MEVNGIKQKLSKTSSELEIATAWRKQNFIEQKCQGSTYAEKSLKNGNRNTTISEQHPQKRTLPIPPSLGTFSIFQEQCLDT